jgi:hypothetical protein
MLTRRGLLISAAGAAVWAGASGSRAAESTTQVIVVDGGRQLTVRVWRPTRARGVVLFSHGGGADPQAYAPLTSAWADAGFLVLAPVHVESVAHPDRAKYNLQTAFGPRIADMRAVSALAAREAPGKPVVAAGHSYGSVFAAMAGGGLRDRGGVRDPSVRGVAMLSSPGVQPGLITDQAYAGLETPLLLMTGDKDTVPGMVPDWRAHLRPFETSPAGDKLAVIRKSGDHNLGLREPGSPAARDTVATTLMFFRAHGLRDAGARRSLSRLASTDAVEIRRR